MPSQHRDSSLDERFTGVIDQLAGGYRTIGQMVYEVIKEAILGGAFAPGEWLRQESLAVAIGVSRIPVRTALLQLESEGLVSFHPHRGARVRTLTSNQINEIYRLRTLLECYALGLSVPNMTKERAGALKSLAEQLDKQPAGGEFLDVRIQFYRELYDAENNPLLVQLIQELRNNVGRYLLGFRFDRRHKLRHVQLAEYVSRGDLKAAESWLRAHLEQVRQGMVLTLETGADGGEGEVPESRAKQREPKARPVKRGTSATAGRASRNGARANG